MAYPWKLGASSYLGLNMKHALDYFDQYEPGDIIIANDAYLTGPLCTHLPDVHILRPIFHGDRVIAWGYAFVHASDIGGTVPASVWPRATEIFQEGFASGPPSSTAPVSSARTYATSSSTTAGSRTWSGATSTRCARRSTHATGGCRKW